MTTQNMDLHNKFSTKIKQNSSTNKISNVRIT